mmetsp:Transcript_3092/g.5205  ORF Transcript_3092/g.5205 Transcript_3092/m.5205 type:complete len:149 (+) Transcript_3092:881-1327(+)
MEVSQLAKDLSDEDYLRLLIVYFCHFELTSNDKATMLKSLNQESHRKIAQNLEYLDEKLVSSSSNKFKRRFKEQPSDSFIEFQRLRAQSEFDILRSETKICWLLKQLHFNQLDTTAYPYVEPPSQETSKKQNKQKKVAKGAANINAFG